MTGHQVDRSDLEQFRRDCGRRQLRSQARPPPISQGDIPGEQMQPSFQRTLATRAAEYDTGSFHFLSVRYPLRDLRSWFYFSSSFSVQKLQFQVATVPPL